VIFTAQHSVSMVLDVAMCLSLCLSVTCRCSSQMAKRRIRQSIPHDDSPVFCCQKSLWNSNGATPNGGAKFRWGRL